MLKKLSSLLSKSDKRFLSFLLVFSLVISAIETIGISAIMPFLTFATDFNSIHSNEYSKNVYNFFNFKNEIDFLVFFGILLICFYLFRSLINLFYYYLLAKFSNTRYHIIVYRLFENYMGMPYKNFIQKNTSTLTKSIINEAANLTGVIISILSMISEIFIMILIYIMMIYVNFKITIVLTLFLVLNAILMTKTISKKIKIIGSKRAEIQRIFYEIINKSFGNFKLIKLCTNEKLLVNEFSQSSFKFSNIAILNSTLKQVPRLLLEGIGFSLIVGIILYLVLSLKDNNENILATVSIFVLSLYRLLPSLTRVLTGYNSIMYGYKSLEIVHNDLMYPSENLGSNKIDFNELIEIKNLKFEYNLNNLVLKNISLKIKKGDKVAFIGESGSGKSTLVDIIIGLYKPLEGMVSIDNEILSDFNVKAWRKKIGYIPQSVYLFDGTVEENVVFNREYDKEKIINALKKANIYDFLEKKDGLNTFVGEGGIMLSGGQKQRIAIARAIYGDPEVLVLDEATSALDDKTESKIMDEIYSISRDKTLIIIAHRLSTVEKCNKVFKIDDGCIINE